MAKPNILGFLYFFLFISIFVSFCYADSQFFIYEIGDNELICSPILDKQFNNIFSSVSNVTCVPEWQCSNYNSCGITDTQSCGAIIDIYNCGIAYTGDFSEFPILPCNFCTEDIQVIDTECYDDGSGLQKFNRSYADFNFGSCCALTGLGSDCHILDFPYNETETKLCGSQFNTTNTIDCNSETYAEYGFGEDKVNWFCVVNQSPETNVTCISYVKDVDGGIVQTNPSYNSKSDTLITQSVEDRTSFMAENGLVQVYFTKENLVFDKRDYVYGVKCSDGNTITEFQKVSVPEYKNINSPLTRMFWIDKNVNAILIGTFILIIIISLVTIGRKMLKK